MLSFFFLFPQFLCLVFVERVAAALHVLRACAVIRMQQPDQGTSLFSVEQHNSERNGKKSPLAPLLSYFYFSSLFHFHFIY